jgi:hypothetical protein
MILAPLLLALLAGCLDNDPIPGGAPASFIALQSDFADFASWEAIPVDTPDTGHPQGDRVVYLNARPEAGAESFPVGTILVKTIDGPGGTDIHAMAKRGDGFNTDGAVGWEWFELVRADDGTPVIKWRGETAPAGEQYGRLPGEEADTADTITGDCNVCHGGERANDYVHTVAL